MPPFPIDIVLERIGDQVSQLDEPVVTAMARIQKDAYMVLIGCMLSLRTKDEVTKEAMERLFARSADPATMVEVPAEELAELIYPVGFYRTKSKQVIETSRRILSDHAGETPRTIEELIKFPGVGRKTANLVMTRGHDLPGICVDTHVHRITNRWGYVETGTPDETEMVLRRELPSRWWKPINDLLVTYGQNICKPISPFCSRCSVSDLCGRVGVGKNR